MTSGARRSPISSTRLAFGIAAAATPGSVATSSLCSFLRRSTIEKNASTSGAGSRPGGQEAAQLLERAHDSVEGTSGTSSRSAAANTLSDTSEIDGAQSRIARS